MTRATCLAIAFLFGTIGERRNLVMETPSVLAKAVKFLDQFDNTGYIISLIKNLYSKDPTVRMKVTMILGEIRDRRIAGQLIEVLIEMSSDSEPLVQWASHKALSALCADIPMLGMCRRTDSLVFLFKRGYGSRSVIVQNLVDLDSIEELLGHESAKVRQDAKKEHGMLSKNRGSMPRAGKIKTKQNQARHKDKELDIIEELVDMINKGEIKSEEALEERKRKMCEDKGCLPPPSNHAIRMKLGRVEEHELFGEIWRGGKEINAAFAKVRSRPNPKKPLFNYYSGGAYTISKK